MWEDVDGDGFAETGDSGVVISLDGRFGFNLKMRVFETEGVGTSSWLCASGNRARTRSIPVTRGDTNHDGKVDIQDYLYLKNFLEEDGPPPSSPAWRTTTSSRGRRRSPPVQTAT
jgi:hypothetical protein|tara:strand:+ start:336 stop:680 length:345 start_codon:yes stop_codon:yes gene_type:complete